ncbi:MAG: ABC transporter permease, partial [Gammaproteobacteria bacterium]|nr:ABC transporter permease [Gammaproteobacteria bacterium]
MRRRDTFRFALSALTSQLTRAGLTALGVAVGILAVSLLTALGEGVQRFVLAEFSQFGTHLLAVTPGKTQTFGMSGAMVSSIRPLTLDDAVALQRLDGVEGVVPVLQGNARIESGGRSRRVTVLGVGPDVPTVWNLEVARGRFLADDSLQAPRAFAVLGATVERELFSNANPPRNPLGARIGVGHQRYRVVGSMAHKGQMLGMDLDDVVFIPTARALALFDRPGLMEIDIEFAPDLSAERLRSRVTRLLVARHGREDFTVITQAQMLEVLDSILGVLKLSVAALGGIALFVGAVGILTIMTIAVRERTAEVGLLR